MIKKEILKQNIISSLKLDNLDDEKKNALINKMSEVVQKRLSLKAIDYLSPEGKKEFNKLLDNSPEKVMDFLKRIYPNFLKIMQEEVLKLKSELISKFIENEISGEVMSNAKDELVEKLDDLSDNEVTILKEEDNKDKNIVNEISKEDVGEESVILSDSDDYEPVPDPYEGEYRNLLLKLMSSSWASVLYVVISLLTVYVLGYVNNPVILFTAIQIPTVIACSYVISPNPNIFRRLPINWIATAFLSALVYFYKTADNSNGKYYISNLIGIVAWFFAIYWLVNAVQWSLKKHKNIKGPLSRLQFIKLFTKLIATWGAILQIVYFLSWILLPYLENIADNAPSINALLYTIQSTKKFSILRFLPISSIFVALLILVSFRFKDDPYQPKTMSEVLPLKVSSVLASFIVALRIPVWILLVIIGFVSHFTKLFWITTRDFIKEFIVRFCFILFGLILAPAILYFGHMLLLDSLHIVTNYIYSEKVRIFQGVTQFFYVNLLFLAALCIYVVSIPPLSVRYRGETIKTLRRSIHNGIFIQGKASTTAVGQTFSLFGIVAFVVPVASLLPGEPSFGLFSLFYSTIVIICLIFYIFSKNK